MWDAGFVESLSRRRRRARNGQGPSLSQFQETFPDETSCAAFLFGRCWSKGFVCPGCGATRRGAEEPGVHIRMPRLRSTDFGHGGNCDASFQAAADDVVLAAISWQHFQHVGASNWMDSASLARPWLLTRDCVGPWATRIAIPWRASSRSIRRKFPSARRRLFGARRCRQNPRRRGRRGDPSRHQSAQAATQHAKYLIRARPNTPRYDRHIPRRLSGLRGANVKRGATLLTDGHVSYPGLTDYRHGPRIVGKMAGHVVLPD